MGVWLQCRVCGENTNVCDSVPYNTSEDETIYVCLNCWSSFDPRILDEEEILS